VEILNIDQRSRRLLKRASLYTAHKLSWRFFVAIATKRDSYSIAIFCLLA